MAIRERITTVNTVSFVEGILLLQYSEKLSKGDTEQARWTLRSALKKFDGNPSPCFLSHLGYVSDSLSSASLLHVPGGRQELYYRALCLFRLATVEVNIAKAIRQLELANNLLEFVLENYQNEVSAKILYARVLHAIGVVKNNQRVPLPCSSPYPHPDPYLPAP